jgi:hypothetical protein
MSTRFFVPLSSKAAALLSLLLPAERGKAQTYGAP